jgi:signal transduction histidine kinase
MDLSRAQRQLDRDPGAARTTLTEAADLARETLEELRALSRGIAPPVVADRGLAAALAALAARAGRARRRPAHRAAGAGHREDRLLRRQRGAGQRGRAQRREHRPVALDCDGRRMRVDVEDDGSGGAVLAPGHGLAGLTDRLQAVDGVLTVNSPRGGPTRLTADLPCA